MAIYQDKAKERIKKCFRKMNGIVAKGIDEDFNEADTRKIVSDMLHDYLGWDKFENLTAEQMIGSRYADYVIRKNAEQIAVIEIKQIGLKLKATHLNQARLYAIDEGIDWVILTNGNTWKVYRMDYTDKSPIAISAFTVSIADNEMKSSEKAELFYLLSEEAHRKNELEDYYQQRVALSGENLAGLILEEDVLTKLRLSIKKSTGQKLTNSDIAESLCERLFRNEIINEGHIKQLRKIKRSEKVKNHKNGDVKCIKTHDETIILAKSS